MARLGRREGEFQEGGTECMIHRERFAADIVEIALMARWRWVNVDRGWCSCSPRPRARPRTRRNRSGNRRRIERRLNRDVEQNGLRTDVTRSARTGWRSLRSAGAVERGPRPATGREATPSVCASCRTATARSVADDWAADVDRSSRDGRRCRASDLRGGAVRRFLPWERSPPAQRR